ncbi:hypothetical protein AMATHDRAFT_142456, partial [Amanita thiersii Skay4041]
KGLSFEDKRSKLLEIFYETKDFYQLKELERLGPKMKGIVSQSIKEVLQSLVDDGFVQTDKIGSSNFFWSFPSQQGVKAQMQIASLTEIQNRHRQQLFELQTTIEEESSARTESELRNQSLQKLADLREELYDFEDKLAVYKEQDPTKFAALKRAAFLAREAVLRWTVIDNYGMLLTFFTRQNAGLDADEVRRYLGIEENYEEIF